MLKKVMVFLMCLVTMIFFISGGKVAAAITTDTCSPDELANHTCGQFGPSTIRFLEARDESCGTAPCTVYFYKYTGPQLCDPLLKIVDVAIPLKLTRVVNTPALIHCSKYFSDGTGDPLNFFWGAGFYDLGICRIIPNDVGGLSNIPLGANFYIVADPSYIDNKMPLNWTVRLGLHFYKNPVVGPVSSVKEVAPATPTIVTLTSKSGNDCSYKILDGQVTDVVCPSGGFIPINDAKLCLKAKAGQTPTFGNWYCENIAYVSDQADIKTTGKDPCRSVGGGLLCW